MITTLVVTTRVAFTGAVDKQITFGLATSEYVFENIDGLGPVRATIERSNTVAEAGSVRLSAKDDERNIVLTMGFGPQRGSGNTSEDLRRALYPYLMPKTIVELDFIDNVIGRWRIKGTVESHEPSIFSKDPQVVISILCTDPYFYSVDAPWVIFDIPEPPTTADGNNAQYFVMESENDVPVGIIWEGTTIQSTTQIRLTMNSFQPNTLPPEGLKALYQPQFRLERELVSPSQIRISSVRNAYEVWLYPANSTGSIDGTRWLTSGLSNMKLQPGKTSFSTSTPFRPGFNAYRRLVDGVIRYPRARGGM